MPLQVATAGIPACQWKSHNLQCRILERRRGKLFRTIATTTSATRSTAFPQGCADSRCILCAVPLKEEHSSVSSVHLMVLRSEPATIKATLCKGCDSTWCGSIHAVLSSVHPLSKPLVFELFNYDQNFPLASIPRP